MFDFEINDRVLLETATFGNLEASIVGYDTGKFRFKLRDTVLIETGKTIPGNRFVHNRDIINASVLNRDPEDSVNDSGIGSSDSNSDNSSVEDPSEGISINDLETLKTVSKTYRFIQNHDRLYAFALSDLNEHEYIGFIAEDSEFRTQNLHMIAMSTPDHIYVFDILSLGKMPEDMKRLLESKIIKKIVFNSDRLGDSLKFHYNVILDGVFDVQLADSYISKIKTGEYPSTLLSYEECVSRYLKIPAHVYIKKPTLLQNQIRPLPDTFKAQLAQNISFMQKLSMKLYNNIMGPLYSACSHRTNSIRTEKDMYDAGVKIVENENTTEDLIAAFNAHEIE